MRLYSFVALLSGVYDRVAPQSQKSLVGRMQSGLRDDVGISPLAYELTMASDLMQKGVDVEWRDWDAGWFRPGQYEIVVGKGAEEQFDGLKVGDRVALPSGDWLVTGTFESNGGANESELITDAATLLSAMRTSAYKSMTVRLISHAAFSEFKNAITSRPGPALEINRESDWYAEQSKSFDDFLKSVAYVVGGIMGLGATFGALNTMYSAIATRAREIATLRAIGFGGTAVIVSVMSEALLFCLIGAALGVAFAWALFNGYQHAMNGLVIRLAVTPMLATTGIGFALLLGLAGGLFPAARAARMPIVDALRAK